MDTRFDARLLIDFFLEAFATRTLVRFLFRKYAGVRPLRAEDNDVRLRQYFPSELVEAVLNRPPNVKGDLATFIDYCETAVARWEIRRDRERKLALGIKLPALIVARLAQAGLIIAGVFWNGWMLVVLALSMMVAAILSEKLA